jgi:hypothetical protein
MNTKPDSGISFATLDRIAAELAAFRKDGGSKNPLVLFDSRDHGNYGDYYASDTTTMLRKHDPTGLADGLLLNEKIEATISGSKVQLSRVLREGGYIGELCRILELKRDLMAQIAAPMAALTEYLASCLQSINIDIPAPTSREVALCLRDAIYCIDKGMSLRWLQCDSMEMPPHLPISPVINQYPNIVAFTDDLRTVLPFGAHLARIGRDYTAIGLKHLGKIAFMSSMTINLHTGNMEEQLVGGNHMAEPLDIDHAVARYPRWVTTQRGGSSRSMGDQITVHGADSHEINHISLLPTDRLIWLAMTVEIASQQMAGTAPSSIELAESVTRALPEHSAANLPMVITPNWTAEDLTVEGMFDSLGFTDWERNYLSPALKGMTVKHFMPEGPVLGLMLDTGELVEWPAQFDSRFSYSDAARIKENAVQLISVSSSWVGTKEEIDKARRAIFAHNLAAFLMGWGNRRFLDECKRVKPWFDKHLRANIENALRHPCVIDRDKEFSVSGALHLYSQSPKHKTYNPRCFFDRKSAVHQVAYIFPQTSTDLVEILGLKRESELPSFLRYWRRDLGWTTVEKGNQYNIHEKWCFSKHAFRQAGRCRILEATVCLGMAHALSTESMNDTNKETL